MDVTSVHETNKPVEQAYHLLQEADAILIGAGAGMSIPAGIDLNDRKAFADAFPAMLSYGFEYAYQLIGYPYHDEKLRWGYLSASLMQSARLGIDSTYQNLKDLVGDKNYFIITTNVDQLFYKNGFDPERIYTPQGNSFLFQCKTPCSDHVWDALPLLEEMEKHIDTDTQYLTDDSYVPTCPNCGGEVYMNVRSGMFFIDNHYQSKRQEMNQWLEQQKDKKLVLLEIGVGFNTPGVIRQPFEQFTQQHEQVPLIRINPLDPSGPDGTVLISAGIEQVLETWANFQTT